jgi:hypothetical protein
MVARSPALATGPSSGVCIRGTTILRSRDAAEGRAEGGARTEIRISIRAEAALEVETRLTGRADNEREQPPVRITAALKHEIRIPAQQDSFAP